MEQILWNLLRICKNKILHDLDYFLLRYGIEDVGKYTKDGSVVAKYYGVLMVYEKDKNTSSNER